MILTKCAVETNDKQAVQFKQYIYKYIWMSTSRFTHSKHIYICIYPHTTSIQNINRHYTFIEEMIKLIKIQKHFRGVLNISNPPHILFREALSLPLARCG